MTGSRPMVRDESVSFSLLELARLEEERVKKEARDLRCAREAALARARAEEKEREGEARRAETARREEEERKREQDARLDAMQRALVERAIAEAEGRARAEDRERARAHELTLERVRHDPLLRRYKRLAAMGGFLAGSALVANTVVYASVWRPQAERRVSFAIGQLADSQKTVRELRTHSEEDGRTIAGLKSELEDTRSEARTAVRDLDEARAQLARLAPPKGHGTVQHPPPPRLTGPLSDECAGSHDPLCGLKH
jgi:hypothetical protein